MIITNSLYLNIKAIDVTINSIVAGTVATADPLAALKILEALSVPQSMLFLAEAIVFRPVWAFGTLLRLALNHCSIWTEKKLKCTRIDLMV